MKITIQCFDDVGFIWRGDRMSVLCEKATTITRAHLENWPVKQKILMMA